MVGVLPNISQAVMVASMRLSDVVMAGVMGTMYRTMTKVMVTLAVVCTMTKVVARRCPWREMTPNLRGVGVSDDHLNGCTAWLVEAQWYRRDGQQEVCKGCRRGWRRMRGQHWEGVNSDCGEDEGHDGEMWKVVAEMNWRRGGICERCQGCTRCWRGCAGWSWGKC